MPDYKLLIFDWDGTLVDSIARIVTAMHQAADLCGVPRRSDEAVKGIIGLALPQAITTLYPELGEAAHVERFHGHYSACYVAMDQTPSGFFPGVEQSLARFREQGYQLAVATGKSRRGLQRILDTLGWQDYFDITRCADETASKPDPLMLQEILQHCGVTAEQALMVGDSSFDLLMAQRAGMDSVAVGYGAQTLEALSLYQPKLSIDHFMQLSTWLSSRVAETRTEEIEHVG
ncbi:HAD-IA family hydrolase [Pseudomonas argentinensis]|uniref:Phosphoglycolate phosphatase n=1 Tax=Phytopseudomonas argentinensis TaxID=289370 RepID=A0A1I3GTQ8_9GAMM|nr:HAD-IA family hydrolase [Pseudomonas argentinensis]KAB0548888.1 HAD-IA family hydrolase [Pseudomonas argentinensis]SFI26935.1 phosphoglycolate phosphatase [Pseudomonas argentinensis]